MKLGFDVKNLEYPEWFIDLLNQESIDINLMPHVVEPGQMVGTIAQSFVSRFGFSPSCSVMAGMTTRHILISSSRIIISYHHPVSSSRIIISYHNRYDDPRIDSAVTVQTCFQSSFNFN